MAEHHRPWPLAAGVLTAVAGVTLIILAATGSGIVSAKLAAAVVVAAALLELSLGALLTRRGGPGMSHVFAGALALGLAAVALPGVKHTTTIALALGLYCLLNGLFRGIDVVIDRPRASLPASIDGAFSFVVGAVLLGHWRDASPSFIAVAAGIELISGGLALFASWFVYDREPEEPPYDGRSDRLVRVKSR